MTALTLEIHLVSDTTFARGDGVAGVVDQDVEQDLLTGLPVIKGRTLKGLLVEECGNILYSLQATGSPAYTEMEAAAYHLFGVPGSGLHGQSILHIGAATLPPELIEMVQAGKYHRDDVLNALTAIRHQTAVDPQTESPLENTLRASRVVLRNTVFLAPVDTERDLEPAEEALLAACIAAVRRAGQSRNRGRGHVCVTAHGLPDDALLRFAAYVRGTRA